MGSGTQGLGSAFSAFPGQKQETGKAEQLIHKPASIWDTGAADEGVDYSATVSGAEFCFCF